MGSRPLVSAALLARVQAMHARTMYQTADLWRINPQTGRRVLVESGIAVALYPGGDVNLTDSNLGVTGQNSTYIGFADRDTDIRENDQLRSVTLANGDLWMERYDGAGEPTEDGTRFTIGTVERWPAVIRLRLSEEGS